MHKRRNHDAVFKARVAREALKGERIVADLAADYDMHLTAEPQGESEMNFAPMLLIDKQFLGNAVLRRAADHLASPVSGWCIQVQARNWR